jgi:hypothetical protein
MMNLNRKSLPDAAGTSSTPTENTVIAASMRLVEVQAALARSGIGVEVRPLARLDCPPEGRLEARPGD